MAGLYDSGDDEDVEKFHVTNEDLLREFDPDRPQFKQTKEDALYGIWADRDKSGYSNLAAKRKEKYQGPVSFVSGGTSKIGKNDENENDNKNTAASSASTLDGSVSRSYNLAPNSKKEKIDKDFANFTRHTKGFGLKYMKMHGYKVGKGLGKSNQGIVNPIEAHKRVRKVGLGAAGTERTKQSHIHFPVEDGLQEDDKEDDDVGVRWKKDEVGVKKSKYKFRTLDDVRRSGASISAKSKMQDNKVASGVDRITSNSSVLTNVKVIDMTRKEKKVFSGYHAIAGRGVPMSDDDSDYSPDDDDQQAERFSCPELLHNIQTLIEDTEQRIISNDRQRQYESDRFVTLEKEEETLQKTIEKEKVEILQMEKILKLVSQCEDVVELDETCRTKLDSLAEVIQELQENYFTEYRSFELQDLAVILVKPQLNLYFSQWKPLEDPEFGVHEMSRWKKLLQLDGSSLPNFQQKETTDVYQDVMYNVWMPKIQLAINSWNPHDANQLLILLESWMHLIPGWMMQQILNQMVMVQLEQAVNKWNPLTDALPLHTWIHPWLPLMNSLLEPLYQIIQGKLAMALDKWDPRDSSALIILKPWYDVFSRGSWDAFMTKTIVPKLSQLMKSFVVDPSNQNLDNFNKLLSWQKLLPHQSLVTILDKYFFPKWLRALSDWLNNNADYDEVDEWFRGWKRLFPSWLIDNQFIKDRFRQGYEFIERVIRGQQRARNQRSPSPPPARVEQNRQKMTVDAPQGGIKSFKSLVQHKALSRGILFLPLGKNTNNQNLYQFGENTIITIENDCIFRKVNDSYVPTKMSDLFNS